MSVSRGRGARNLMGLPASRHAALSWRLLGVAAFLLLCAACTRRQTATSQMIPTASAIPATPAPGARNTPYASATPTLSSTVLTLTIWGPDWMAPLPDVPGGPILAQQIAAFQEAHPNWRVQYIRKKPYGQGGLTHFLRATRAVAPDSLPDLALVDMSEIGLLAADGLLQPLDSPLGPEMIADLVPFAKEAGQVGEQLLAVQYEADLRFLAYNSAVIGRPPSTWAEVLNAGHTYLLPIGNSEGAVRDAFLPQYFALGGKLVDRDGHPSLDKAVVAAILDVYHSARQAGLLPAAGFDLQDASDCWPVYLASSAPSGGVTAAMTNVNSWDYGRDRTRLAKTRVAPLPTLSGTLASLSTGWGWGVLCKDATRRAAAVAFLRWILQPEAMAAWCRATYHLPTRRSALPLAVSDQEYLRFLQQLVEAATPQPREPIYTWTVDALRPAIEGVTRGTVSPQNAAAEAADRMRIAQGAQSAGPQ